jgi:hypothetical protein
VDPEVIRLLRLGQLEEADRALAALIAERGGDVDALLHAVPPGGLGDELVRLGRLGADEVARFRAEAELRGLLAAVNALPEEAAIAARDPAARLGKYVLVRRVGRGDGRGLEGWDVALARWTVRTRSRPATGS